MDRFPGKVGPYYSGMMNIIQIILDLKRHSSKELKDQLNIVIITELIIVLD